MRLVGIVALLGIVSSDIGAAQDKPRPENQYVQKCTPEVISRARHGKSPEFHFRKGEKYEHSPIVACEILESGEISHVFVKRGSGIADLDRYELKWVQELKYNKRPGCGVSESQVSVTIDFTGAQ